MMEKGEDAWSWNVHTSNLLQTQSVLISFSWKFLFSPQLLVHLSEYELKQVIDWSYSSEEHPE